MTTNRKKKRKSRGTIDVEIESPREAARGAAFLAHPYRRPVIGWMNDLENLTWQDLVQHPWISPTSRRSHTVLDHVMNTMNVGPPQQVTVCGSVSLLKSLVATSDYLALLPVHAAGAELAEGRLVALPFEDPVLQRNIAVFFREGYEMDAPRRDLVACVRNCGLEIGREPLAPKP